jgi:hypothetical protein
MHQEPIKLFQYTKQHTLQYSLVTTNLQTDETDSIWQWWNLCWHLFAVHSCKGEYIATVHDRKKVEQKESQAWIKALS